MYHKIFWIWQLAQVLCSFFEKNIHQSHNQDISLKWVSKTNNLEVYFENFTTFDFVVQNLFESSYLARFQKENNIMQKSCLMTIIWSLIQFILIFFLLRQSSDVILFELTVYFFHWVWIVFYRKFLNKKQTCNFVHHGMSDQNIKCVWNL